MPTVAGLISLGTFEDANRRLLKATAIPVYNKGTNVLASLYANRGKTIAAANPVITDAYGNLPEVYAEPGLYDYELRGLRLPLTVGVDPTDGMRYYPVTPARVFDTRFGTGGVPAAPIAGGGVLTVQITGQGGIPAGAKSVVILATLIPEGTGHLVIYPAGEPLPPTSNANFSAGLLLNVLALATLPPGGGLNFYNGAAGPINVIGDVSGWFG